MTFKTATKTIYFTDGETMSLVIAKPRIGVIVVALSLALGGGSVLAKDVKVTLSGAEETPPVTTSATASGTIKIASDGAVSGSVKSTEIDGIAAHIHVGAPGQAGPPIITLDKGADGVWSVPAGAKLTQEQLASFKAGNLYVNVHSAEHKPGEIRAQLKP
jgi:CHRD domain-containing protein